MGPLVKVTDEARQYISALLASNPGMQLAVSINDKGCSGHKYQYDLLPVGSNGTYDEVIEWEDGRLVIAANSVMHLIGSTLQLRHNQFEQQLVWENPMAVNTCGCGESFQLCSDS